MKLTWIVAQAAMKIVHFTVLLRHMVVMKINIVRNKLAAMGVCWTVSTLMLTCGFAHRYVKGWFKKRKRKLIWTALQAPFPQLISEKRDWSPLWLHRVRKWESSWAEKKLWHYKSRFMVALCCLSLFLLYVLVWWRGTTFWPLLQSAPCSLRHIWQ